MDKENTPANPSPAQPPPQQNIVFEKDKATVTYSNLCRGIMTAEEIILDFALNPNMSGRVVEENVEVTSRVVMSFSSAKRLLHLLHAMISRHEQQFGEIPVDPSQRNKAST